MNTQAHLVVGAAVFSRPGAARINIAAIAGSVAPDISLFMLGSHALFFQGHSPSFVFGDLYYSDEWQAIFAVDNSLFLWTAVLSLGWLARIGWIKVFGGAGLLHIATDFPLHHDDGRQHFQPFSDWVFESPISYWDAQHYGGIVGAIEVVLVLFLCAVLMSRFKSILARSAIVFVGLFEAVPTMLFIFA